MTCVICGQPMSLGAMAGGHDRHPGCEPQVRTTEWRWACVRCLAGGEVANPSAAVSKSIQHDADCPA